MNDFQTTNPIATAPAGYCSNCLIAEVTNPPALCGDCRRTNEIDSLLEIAGVTREKVTSELIEAEPVKDWADELKEKQAADDAEAAKPALNGTANQIADNLVPAFGEALKPYEQTALAYGFPPQVDALITKTGIDAERAEMVLVNFRQAFALAEAWRQRADAIVVTDETQTDLIAEAKRLHKIVRDDRINVEKKRKELKERPLREGQLIDGIANAYKDLLEPIESHLLKGAKFVENLEAERKSKLAEERGAKLALFEVDPKTFPNLGDMTDEAFEIVYNGVRQRYQEIQAEAESRLQAERDREIENERLRQENARLEAERKAEADRAAEQQRIADAATAELQAQKDAEAKKEAERKAEEERLRLAPDKDKLLDFADRIALLAGESPNIDSKFAPLLGEIEHGLLDLAKQIRESIEKF